MKLIVDASVAVKWLFAESHSRESRQLLAPPMVLHAPDFILTEVANVICVLGIWRHSADDLYTIATYRGITGCGKIQLLKKPGAGVMSLLGVSTMTSRPSETR